MTVLNNKYQLKHDFYPEKSFEDLIRCKECVLPETFPGIHYDEQGICNYCKDWRPIQVLGEEKLKKKILRFKNKGKKYDIIVPISGGRDSSFVLYNIVEKFNARVLTLTVDSGFITDEGYKNITSITEALDVKHIWIKNDKKNEISMKNCIKKFHGWLNKPSIHTIVPVLNSGDKTMNYQMFKYAKRNDIPLIMGGNNIGNSIFEQEHWKTGFLNIFPNERGFYSNHNKIKLLYYFGKEYIKNPMNLKIAILKEYLNGIFVYFFEKFLKSENIETIGFYDYIYWREDDVVASIRNNLGWCSAEDASTTWRIDDLAYPLINYIYFNLVGFTEHDEMYSKMVREGQITRENALQRLEEDHKPRLLSIKQFLKKLNVHKEELDFVLKKYSNKILKKLF